MVSGQKLIAKPLNVCKQRSDIINVEDHIFCWHFKVSHVGCVYAWTSIMQAEWGQIPSSLSTGGWFHCFKRWTSKTACWRSSAIRLSIDHWSFWIFSQPLNVWVAQIGLRAPLSQEKVHELRPALVKIVKKDLIITICS